MPVAGQLGAVIRGRRLLKLNYKLNLEPDPGERSKDSSLTLQGPGAGAKADDYGVAQEGQKNY